MPVAATIGDSPVETASDSPAPGPRFGTAEARAAARDAVAARRAAWAPVRQPCPGDREYLKAILRARQVSHIPEAEPATARRLARLLRRAGLSMAQAREAVGLRLEDYVGGNPGRALWWLAAAALEASG